MDKATAQRMQAILALMIGAFTFGCYITYQESVTFAEKKAQELRIQEFIKDDAGQDADIKAMKERILRLEILAG